MFANTLTKGLCPNFVYPRSYLNVESVTLASRYLGVALRRNADTKFMAREKITTDTQVNRVLRVLTTDGALIGKQTTTKRSTAKHTVSHVLAK